MNHAITQAEIIDLLRALSKIEGFLLKTSSSEEVSILLSESTALLLNKLAQSAVIHPHPDLTDGVFFAHLSARTTNALSNGGYRTVAQVLEAFASELLLCPNLGHRSLNEITATLQKYGLTLRSEKPPSKPV